MSLTTLLTAHKNVVATPMTILVVEFSVLLVRRAYHACIFCMGLDMFLQVLRSFERLSAELAAMWFQRHMDTNV